MSKYTTGELAKLCGVTVRTVQYYSRNILVPSALSEGGRRLYSEEDLKRLKIICFLRELGLPIHSIGQLLSEENPGSVIELLLEQQERALKQEIDERREQLDKLERMRRELKSIEHFCVESIGDIAYMMENKRKLRRERGLLLAIGIPLDLIQIAAVVLWVTKGVWWPFAAWLVLDLTLGGWAAWRYMKRMAYICPVCHGVFRAKGKEALFARHTPSARKLTCARCGHHGFCVEVYHDEKTADG